MKILVIDDHPLYIDGLKSLLMKHFKDLKIVEASQVEQAITVFSNTEFDLVLIDYKFPEMNGHDLVQAFAERGTITPLAIISGEDDPQIAKKALDLGASGFIPKSLLPDELAGAIRTVLNGGEYLTDKMRAMIDQLNRSELADYAQQKQYTSLGITTRQLEVLKLMAKGYTNKRISQVLNISIDTVKEHIRNIFIALDADNRVRCITRAKALGLDLD